MGSTDEDADIRRPSINTEPRTLSESTIERALVHLAVSLIGSSRGASSGELHKIRLISVSRRKFLDIFCYV